MKHLKDEHNKFLSLAELQLKYSLKVCLLKYLGLVSALKSLWTTCKTNCIKNCNNYETFVGFLQYLKSFYHIETTADPILPKKWENVSSLFQ